MKDYDINKESLYIQYQNVSNLYASKMLRKCIKDTFQFNKDFIKKYNEESDEGYFPEADV